MIDKLLLCLTINENIYIRLYFNLKTLLEYIILYETEKLNSTLLVILANFCIKVIVVKTHALLYSTSYIIIDTNSMNAIIDVRSQLHGVCFLHFSYMKN